ncbi:methylamine utilization protein [Novosphingobium marinum]|uniref:methylamine utilization protein n=1 Tax=Novosphingobium marinum TaxID=1514948 RepID=UPI001E476CCC|nr:methylamine utilization protein [Novosphingobium marinum]
MLITSGLACAAGFAANAAPSSSITVQLVDQRGLPVRDAVVELKPAGGTSGRISFPWRKAMAQKDREFVPGTLIVARGSTVAFPNLDNVRHSIYSFSKAAKFSIDLYGRDQTRTQGFLIAGTVALGCNIHDEMRGYIRVTDTPFAGKTDHNGFVTLTSVPAGGATVGVWHPRLRSPGNETSSDVTISSGSQSRRYKLRMR